MTAKLYDLAVFIGRFQPFHNGHLAVVKRGLELADRVLILVGSANRVRDTRNPFTYEERSRLIWDSVIAANIEAERIDVDALSDSSNPVWIADVQHAVKRAAGTQVAPRVTIIGHERDETSGYLRWFPNWHYNAVEEHEAINATAIRETVLIRDRDFISLVSELPVAPSVRTWLGSFIGSDPWWALRAEREAEQAYRERWGDKEPHLTADAVVIQSGHVLVIRRGQYPGKGALALPGGFKERGETLLQSACRELREETSLDYPQAVLERFLIGSDVFDDPLRSRRGEIVTRAFFFSLPDGPLPYVKGADDAAEAFWLPISEVRYDAMFEDHAEIINRALAQLERKP